MPKRNLIQDVLSARNWSLSELSERVAYEERTLKRVISGEIPLSPKLEKLLHRHLESSSNGISTLEEPPNMESVVLSQTRHEGAPATQFKARPPIRKIPVIGWAQAGEATSCEEIKDADDYVLLEVRTERAVGVRVRGDSMEEEIQSGDIVVLSCTERPQNGDIVVARLKDEGVVCKRFQIIDPSRRLFRLTSTNMVYVPIERSEDQFYWIYPVVSLVRNMQR